jgi:hypothetical protein
MRASGDVGCMECTAAVRTAAVRTAVWLGVRCGVRPQDVSGGGSCSCRALGVLPVPQGGWAANTICGVHHMAQLHSPALAPMRHMAQLHAPPFGPHASHGSAACPSARRLRAMRPRRTFSAGVGAVATIYATKLISDAAAKALGAGSATAGAKGED